MFPESAVIGQGVRHKVQGTRDQVFNKANTVTSDGIG